MTGFCFFHNHYVLMIGFGLIVSIHPFTIEVRKKM